MYAQSVCFACSTTPTHAPNGLESKSAAVCLCYSHPAMIGRVSRPWAGGTRDQGASREGVDHGAPSPWLRPPSPQLSVPGSPHPGPAPPSCRTRNPHNVVGDVGILSSLGLPGRRVPMLVRAPGGRQRRRRALKWHGAHGPPCPHISQAHENTRRLHM